MKADSKSSSDLARFSAGERALIFNFQGSVKPGSPNAFAARETGLGVTCYAGLQAEAPIKGAIQPVMFDMERSNA
jgi:hypothetical protein